MKVIAELGNTHEGSVGLAKKMIAAALNSGADIVKLQTHIFEAESLPNAPNPPYFEGESRKDYFDRTAFTKAQYLDLMGYCSKIGIELISSPFSIEALNLLLDVGMKTIKIPSGEVSNELLLREIAKHQVEVILSSGMSSEDELDRAVETLKSGANRKLTILQCTSEYPCPPEQVGLQYISELKEKYGVAVGFSDHTLSESIPAVAVYAGATVVEKHFTLSKSMYGSDASNSLEPESFARMVGFIKEAEILRNTSPSKDVDREYIRGMKQVFEKSLVYKASYPAGHILSYDDVTAKKPGHGVPTRRVDDFLGKELKHSVVSDTFLLEGDFHY